MEKKISIVIPAYNAEKYIARCLDSIIKQENAKIEVIIVNDGSKDKTVSICENYQKQYDFINVISQKNGGVSAARNNGIKNAKGEYILFLDADDFLADDAIEWALESAINKDVLNCGSFNYIKTRNRILPHHLSVKTYDLTEEYVDNIIDVVPNAPWAKLYYREIIETNNIRFPEGIPYAEDTIFMLEYMKYIRYVNITDKIVYNYNYTDSGSAMWKFYPDFYKYMREVMNKKKQLCDIKNIEYNQEHDKEKYFKRCLNHYIRNNKKEYIGEVIDAFNLSYNVKDVVHNWFKSNWMKYIIYRLKKKIL